MKVSTLVLLGLGTGLTVSCFGEKLVKTGDTVTLGEGIFEIDSRLMVSNGVTLAGQGWYKTIVKQVGTPTDSSRVVTVSGDPKFAADYALASDSPAKGAGTGCTGIGVRNFDATK